MPRRKKIIQGALYRDNYLTSSAVAANANNVQEEKDSALAVLERAQRIAKKIKVSNKSMSRDIVKDLAPQYEALCNLKGTIQVAFNKENYTEITSQHSSALDRAESAYDNSVYEISMDQARAHAESCANAERNTAGWDNYVNQVCSEDCGW